VIDITPPHRTTEVKNEPLQKLQTQCHRHHFDVERNHLPGERWHMEG
jgi:hypothetical protein